VVLNPHLGYSTREVFEKFYRENEEYILTLFDGCPQRTMNPETQTARKKA
jgi:phosphoglycerate dehydrogenase-like enzyme